MKIRINTINGIVVCERCGLESGEHEFTVGEVAMPGTENRHYRHGPPTVPADPVDLDSALDEFVSTSEFPKNLCAICERQEELEYKADQMMDHRRDEGH